MLLKRCCKGHCTERTNTTCLRRAWTIAIGNSADLRKAADDLEVINQASTQAYLDRAGDKLTPERLKEMLDAETYLTAEQCIEFGLADKHEEDAEQPEEAPAQQKAADDAKHQAVREEMQRRYDCAMAVINKYFK